MDTRPQPLPTTRARRSSARPRMAAIAVVAVLVVTLVGPGVAWGQQLHQFSYRAATTIVVTSEDATLVDRGMVICNITDPTTPSIGGACVPFGPGNGILVQDTRAGTDVAFQVCIDNDGDGRCGGDLRAACGDDMFFSHDDTRFFNPLGPLPNSFRAGCENSAGFPGYVVFLCTGVHDFPRPHIEHAHSGTVGSVLTSGTLGQGDFCRPAGGEPAKRYVIR